MMTIKEQLHHECQRFLDDRLATVISRIDNIQESLQSETKSSAGDKHETGRAMLQLEREKAGNQLKAIVQQQQKLTRVPVTATTDVVKLGSIVKTDKRNFYLAISVGELKLEDELFYGIATISPIGKQLVGKSVGEVAVFNSITYAIKEVL